MLLAISLVQDVRDEGEKARAYVQHAALIKLIYANEASYNKLIWS